MGARNRPQSTSTKYPRCCLPTKRVHSNPLLQHTKRKSESPSLLSPSASNFSSQDHQARSGTVTHQLWVGGIFPLPRPGQHGAINVRNASVWGVIAMQKRHQCHVHRQLNATEQGQPATISNLRLSLARGIGEIQTSDHDVFGDSGTTLTTDSRPCAFHCQNTACPTRQQLHTTHDGGHKGREDVHIDTRVQREVGGDGVGGGGGPRTDDDEFG